MGSRIVAQKPPVCNGCTGKAHADWWVALARHLLVAFVLAVVTTGVLAGNARAQANIHNGGVTLNAAQNTTAVPAPTLTNRGSDSVGSLPYNGARFNFTASVASSGNWVGGVQYQIQGGKQMIWVQPANITFTSATVNGTDVATYTMVFTRGVLGLTFRIGGMDFRDGVRLQFLNNGTALNVDSTWVTANVPNGTNVLAVSSISATQLRVASTNDNGSSTDTSLNYVQFTVPSGTVVDEVRVLSAKETGTSNNTIGFHDFNWLPMPIDAVNDSASGINGAAGQADVITVLANDTLNNPDTPAVDAATLSTVTVSQVSTTNAGVTLNPATGTVSVAAGTAPGTHVVTYQICENNTAPANCDTATATVTVAPRADLVTIKTLASGDATPNVGDTVSFLITVANNGPSNATGVSLTDLLPSGLTAAAGNGTVSAGSYNAASGLWTIAAIANGASATLTLTGTVNAGQGGSTITNTLASPATGAEPDPTNTGNDLTESVSAVAIAAGADNGSAVAGIASTPVADVRANDTINGAQATATNSTVAVSGTWPAGITLNPTTGAISVSSAVPAGTYTLDYQLCDLSTPANCTIATATITVNAPQVDLTITKSNGTTQVTSGSSTTYTITVTNTGPDPVTGALVKDTAFSGITCSPSGSVTITGSGIPAGSYNFSDLSGAGIALGTLANGQAASLSYSCQVN